MCQLKINLFQNEVYDLREKQDIISHVPEMPLSVPKVTTK
jgi:hypothetical protein